MLEGGVRALAVGPLKNNFFAASLSPVIKHDIIHAKDKLSIGAKQLTDKGRDRQTDRQKRQTNKQKEDRHDNKESLQSQTDTYRAIIEFLSHTVKHNVFTFLIYLFFKRGNNIEKSMDEKN